MKLGKLGFTGKDKSDRTKSLGVYRPEDRATISNFSSDIENLAYSGKNLSLPSPINFSHVTDCKVSLDGSNLYVIQNGTGTDTSVGRGYSNGTKTLYQLSISNGDISTATTVSTSYTVNSSDLALDVDGSSVTPSNPQIVSIQFKPDGTSFFILTRLLETRGTIHSFGAVYEYTVTTPFTFTGASPKYSNSIAMRATLRPNYVQEADATYMTIGNHAAVDNLEFGTGANWGKYVLPTNSNWVRFGGEEGLIFDEDGDFFLVLSNGEYPRPPQTGSYQNGTLAAHEQYEMVYQRNCDSVQRYDLIVPWYLANPTCPIVENRDTGALASENPAILFKSTAYGDFIYSWTYGYESTIKQFKLKTDGDILDGLDPNYTVKSVTLSFPRDIVGRIHGYQWSHHGYYLFLITDDMRSLNRVRNSLMKIPATTPFDISTLTISSSAQPDLYAGYTGNLREFSDPDVATTSLFYGDNGNILYMLRWDTGLLAGYSLDSPYFTNGTSTHVSGTYFLLLSDIDEPDVIYTYNPAHPYTSDFSLGSVNGFFWNTIGNKLFVVSGDRTYQIDIDDAGNTSRRWILNESHMLVRVSMRNAVHYNQELQQGYSLGGQIYERFFEPGGAHYRVMTPTEVGRTSSSSNYNKQRVFQLRQGSQKGIYNSSGAISLYIGEYKFEGTSSTNNLSSWYNFDYLTSRYTYTSTNQIYTFPYNSSDVTFGFFETFEIDPLGKYIYLQATLDTTAGGNLHDWGEQGGSLSTGGELYVNPDILQVSGGDGLPPPYPRIRILKWGSSIPFEGTITEHLPSAPAVQTNASNTEWHTGNYTSNTDQYDKLHWDPTTYIKNGNSASEYREVVGRYWLWSESVLISDRSYALPCGIHINDTYTYQATAGGTFGQVTRQACEHIIFHYCCWSNLSDRPTYTQNPNERSRLAIIRWDYESSGGGSRGDFDSYKLWDYNQQNIYYLDYADLFPTDGSDYYNVKQLDARNNPIISARWGDDGKYLYLLSHCDFGFSDSNGRRKTASLKRVKTFGDARYAPYFYSSLTGDLWNDLQTVDLYTEETPFYHFWFDYTRDDWRINDFAFSEDGLKVYFFTTKGELESTTSSNPKFVSGHITHVHKAHEQVYEASLSTAWDLTTLQWKDNSGNVLDYTDDWMEHPLGEPQQSYSSPSEENGNIHFQRGTTVYNKNDTDFYYLQTYSDKRLVSFNHYTLKSGASSPYNISDYELYARSATSSSQALRLSESGGLFGTLTFSSDGSKIYLQDISTSQDITTIPLNTNWDITTIDNTGITTSFIYPAQGHPVSINAINSSSHDENGEETHHMTGFAFNSNGTKLLTRHKWNENIYNGDSDGYERAEPTNGLLIYDVPTPWDVTSIPDTSQITTQRVAHGSTGQVTTYTVGDYEFYNRYIQSIDFLDNGNEVLIHNTRSHVLRTDIDIDDPRNTFPGYIGDQHAWTIRKASNGALYEIRDYVEGTNGVDSANFFPMINGTAGTGTGTYQLFPQADIYHFFRENTPRTGEILTLTDGVYNEAFYQYPVLYDSYVYQNSTPGDNLTVSLYNPPHDPHTFFYNGRIRRIYYISPYFRNSTRTSTSHVYKTKGFYLIQMEYLLDNIPPTIYNKSRYSSRKLSDVKCVNLADIFPEVDYTSFKVGREYPIIDWLLDSSTYNNDQTKPIIDGGIILGGWHDSPSDAEIGTTNLQLHFNDTGTEVTILNFKKFLKFKLNTPWDIMTIDIKSCRIRDLNAHLLSQGKSSNYYTPSSFDPNADAVHGQNKTRSIRMLEPTGFDHLHNRPDLGFFISGRFSDEILQRTVNEFGKFRTNFSKVGTYANDNQYPLIKDPEEYIRGRDRILYIGNDLNDVIIDPIYGGEWSGSDGDMFYRQQGPHPKPQQNQNYRTIVSISSSQSDGFMTFYILCNDGVIYQFETMKT